MATKVVLNDEQNIEGALKELRRKLQRDRTFSDVKKHQVFMTRKEKLSKKKKLR